MSDESDLLRLRANECRRLARDAKDGYSKRTLTQMASELEAEADHVEKAPSPGVPLYEDDTTSAR